jgi:hypothetical protein
MCHTYIYWLHSNHDMWIHIMFNIISLNRNHHYYYYQQPSTNINVNLSYLSVIILL